MNAKATYIQGETATFTVADSGYAVVNLQYGGPDGLVSVAFTLSGGNWTASVPTAAMFGPYRYAILADGVAIAKGTFAVCVLVSRWRKIVAAIDEAMSKVSANGKVSVSIGEMRLEDKTFDEMRRWREWYADKAAAEEDGATTDGGGRPWREDMCL